MFVKTIADVLVDIFFLILKYPLFQFHNLNHKILSYNLILLLYLSFQVNYTHKKLFLFFCFQFKIF